VDFESLLASLINPGEDGPSPTIYDDLSASYTDATSTRDAKITTVTGELEALQLELLAAKAANWDLMQLIPGTSEVADAGQSTDDDDKPDNDDIGDDEDFFEKKDDN
jgi:hypothetical protein